MSKNESRLYVPSCLTFELVRHFLVCGTTPTSLHEFLFDATSNVSARAFWQVMVNMPAGSVPPQTIRPNVDIYQSRPDLPLHLCNHLHCCSVDFLWHCSLFDNESGCTRMGLYMNGHALFIVHFADLLLMGCFLHFPLWSREDTSI